MSKFLDLTDNKIIFANTFNWAYISGSYTEGTVAVYKKEETNSMFFWRIFKAGDIYNKLLKKGMLMLLNIKTITLLLIA